MLFVIVLLAGLATALFVDAVRELAPSRSRILRRELERLAERRELGPAVPLAAPTLPLRERILALMTRIGAAILRGTVEPQPTKQQLAQAGFRGTEAQHIYWGARVFLAAGLSTTTLLLSTVMGAPLAGGLFLFSWMGAVGWMIPPFALRKRTRTRQREILNTLPDALDLLVVCVEAGLGLNQAIARMAEEIRHFSVVTGGEFGLVQLAIRAGAPREEALRGLSERTGLPEVRALCAVLVQADRFGISIGSALRVHSEGLRAQRRQRAEEAAAKTTVKLVFPLVLCIFPGLFVIILGPAMVQMIRSLTAM